MKSKTEYKGLSSRVKKLLNKPEGIDVEYKTSISGLENTDLVAFANSYEGGTILIGVDEEILANGSQRGEIIGCSIGDNDRLRILNKAEDCVPPIEVDIVLENLSKKPFFRIEIPSGKHKPYCTKKGVYTIRGNGRTNALLPARLLNLFLEIQGETFLNRFQTATQNLDEKFNNMNITIEFEFVQILNTIKRLQGDIDNSLDEIFNSARTAGDLSDEAVAVTYQISSLVDQIDDLVYTIDQQTWRSERKIDALLEHHNIEDPRITDLKMNITGSVFGYLRDHPEATFEEIIEYLSSIFPDIPNERLEEWSIEKYNLRKNNS